MSRRHPPEIIASLASTAVPQQRIDGIRIATLVALAADGLTPLISYPGQPGSQALPARSTVDLQARHIGASLVVMFDEGRPDRPIVMGVIREPVNILAGAGNQVEIDADGERMLVSAKEQIVLRCGKASITLTKAGKVLIQGAYVSSRSTGVNRVKGGSVQLN
ncbi:DUF6484 domain-containing protein [Uliginosibacterium flavum]|uniref:DUF6484 domain-containing protein n=1 Tax=Uliginosibacterium flavum TaxID=1396831 RepID=A0ABV2THY2_9RHOO